jgi:gas vesicle structural protein
MSVVRLAPRTSVIDVLDHVLDKGIVIDAWIRVALAGIDLLTVEARVVVASIGTYVAHARSISGQQPVASPLNAYPGGGRQTLEEQLQEVRALLEAGRAMMGHEHRRAQDRFVDEFRDAHGRTLARTKRPQRTRARRRRR